MKKNVFLLVIAGLLALSGCYLIFMIRSHHPRVCAKPFSNQEKKGLPKSALLPYLAEYQYMKLRDPKSGIIPLDIRSRELSFGSVLPVRGSDQGQSWIWRGPSNIGGRMLCISVDIDDNNHLLAGSASGGMWKSADRGENWQKATSPDAEQSATCIVQDKRTGKHNLWYYGTGELLSTTNRNISTNVRTVGIGNGIFKSNDNGGSWSPLASTQGGSPGVLDEVFQGIWRIATDPVNMNKDVVYAACYGAIMRSENGGVTWQMVLGDLINKSFCTDVAITSEGILYAALGSYSWSVEPPVKAGIWRSTDGFSWEKITPVGFPVDNRVTRLAIAPSNEGVMYVFTESQSSDLNPFNGYTNTVNTFWKMTWDPVGDSAIWENRTTGIPGAGNGSMNSFPYSFVVYGGYCFTMGVKPDNENVVFIGGMNFFRSVNGFSDSLQTVLLGGYPYDMDSLYTLHPDQHGITFMQSDPDILFMANDGGIYVTYDCMADSSNIIWHRLNSNLTTTQYYSVSIDHGSTNDDWILGGLQDNNWYYTVTNDPTEFWFNVDICYDGFATVVAPGWEFCVISAYSGNIWTSQFNEDMHTKNIFPQLPDTLLKYYDPVMGSNSLFPFYQNFALDPNNYETFYLPTVTSIWRKDNIKAAASDTTLRNAGWNHLTNIDVGDASEISSITVSKNPANRVYYGTSLGRIYRLDDANTGDPVPVEITGDGFPQNAFVACIDVDENNADNLIAAFSNYEVQSIFSSTDGGSNWTPQGGNLEENPDGTGAGPSVRWIEFLGFQGHKIWFAGTSIGLFSTTELKGDSTVWLQEGANSIGKIIVDMIDARQSDGFIALGTHGNGVYSAYYNPAAGLIEQDGAESLSNINVYPNPAYEYVNLEFISTNNDNIEISLHNTEGKLVAILFRDKLQPGDHYLKLNLVNVAPGLYYLNLKASGTSSAKKIIVL
jgi:hypothetical protein